MSVTVYVSLMTPNCLMARGSSQVLQVAALCSIEKFVYNVMDTTIMYDNQGRIQGEG